jgi:hypothetical protein
MEAGMFRDGGECNGSFTHHHFLALDGGHLAGLHLEAVGDADKVLVLDLKFIKQIRQQDMGVDSST